MNLAVVTMTAADFSAESMPGCRFRCYGICTVPDLCRKRDGELSAEDHAAIAAHKKMVADYEAECEAALTPEQRAEYERDKPVAKEQMGFAFT